MGAQSLFLQFVDWWCGLFGVTNATTIQIVVALSISGLLYAVLWMAVSVAITVINAVAK